MPGIPVISFPDEPAPVIDVIFDWPNMPPSLVEKKVTSVLEGQFGKIPGITKTESVSGSGNGKISLYFSNRNLNRYNRVEIIRQIDQMLNRLPEGVKRPVVTERYIMNSQTDQHIEIILSSNADFDRLCESLTFLISDRLKPLKGIRDIRWDGVHPPGNNIRLDPVKCEAYCIHMNDVARAIERAYSDEFIGITSNRDTEHGASEMAVRVGPGLKGNGLGTIYVGRAGGKDIFIKDITHQITTFPLWDKSYSFNGLKAVRLDIAPNPGCNLLVLGNQLRKIMEEWRTKSQSGGNNINYAFTSDPSVKLRHSFNTFIFRTLLTLAIMIIFSSIVYRNRKVILTVVMGLFANLFIPFVFFHLFSVRLHSLSLAGLAVSLGIVIDNIIIMMSHLLKHQNRQTILAVLASSLTTLVALLVIFILPQDQRIVLIDFTKVLIINISISFCISLWLIPAFFSIFRIQSDSRRLLNGFSAPYNWIPGIFRFVCFHKRWVILIFILAVGLPLYKLPNKLEGEGLGTVIYNKTLGSSFFINKIKPTTDIILGGSIRLFDQYVMKDEIIQEKETDYISVVAYLHPEHRDQIPFYLLSRLKRKIRQAGICSDILTYYSDKFSEIKIYIPHKKKYQHKAVWLKHKITEWTSNLNGINWIISGFGAPYTVGREIEANPEHFLEVSGYHYETLESLVSKLKDRLQKNPRVILEKELYPVKYLEIVTTDNAWVDNRDISRLISETHQQRNVKTLHVVNLAGEDEQVEISLIKKNDPIQSFLGATVHGVMIGDLVRVRKEASVTPIFRSQQQYVVKVPFSYLGEARFAEAFTDDLIRDMEAQMPYGFQIKYLRPNNKRVTTTDIIAYLMVVIVLIYIISAVLFDSLTQPLAIVMMIPFSFTGVFMAFYFYQVPFGNGGFASLFILSGLTVNAGFYIINGYNIYRKTAGISRIKALSMSFDEKLKPIGMTLTSTLVGLGPFLLANDPGDFWFTLALAISGGLISSIAALIFILPALILWKKEKYSD